MLRLPERTGNAFPPASYPLRYGTPLITVMFPFDGPNWAVKIPLYSPTVKVTRLGSDKQTRLLMSATDPGDQLCTDWVVQLEGASEIAIGKHSPLGTLKCMDVALDPSKQQLFGSYGLSLQASILSLYRINRRFPLDNQTLYVSVRR
jgi:hypothetical protein